jgi:hypothetical protein
MHAQIGLTVSIEVERAQRNGAIHRLFENASTHRLAAVMHKAWTCDVE